MQASVNMVAPVSPLRKLQLDTQRARSPEEIRLVISRIGELLGAPGMAQACHGTIDLKEVARVLQQLAPSATAVSVKCLDPELRDEWAAEIEMDEGLYCGEGNSAAGALLCALLEVASIIRPTSG
jgi:hypothetical protein